MTLLQDVINAYLAPLLSKHAAGDPVTHDDLLASMEASKAVLANSPNEFVLKRAQNFHNAQLNAYNDSAKKALEQWAQQQSPPAVLKGETQAAYSARCLALVKSTRPKWHLEESELESCIHRHVQQRANEVYAQQQKQHTTGHKRGLSALSSDSGADEEDGEVIDGEEGDNNNNNTHEDDEQNEEEEDGEEEDGEEGEVEDDEEMSQSGDGNSTTVEANTNGNNNTTAKNNGNNNNGKKKKPQQGRNTKKRVIKRKSAIQKKGPPGNQKANNNNNNGAANKKPTTRKKPQGKKGGRVGNNKNA
ncbi:expressed unknown protein [Seminavis robusta]|uniref:Uncharacterized protein n=1 Tax=Seminavis robusta TaxID=568900 RepID=A0A9N8HTL5_9STRA|nr:expressed unknown protein [Seminavis robusta]|eukprot:Sro1902_g304440.1 n/a (303) ;mRNA; f:8104-9131